MISTALAAQAKALSGRLASGAMLNLLNSLAFSLGQLVVVPFLLTATGVRGYEVWILVMSILGFMTIYDLGASAYFSAKIRIAHAKNRLHRSRIFFRQALGMYIFVVCPASAVIFFLPVVLGYFSGIEILFSGTNELIVFAIVLVAYLVLLPRTLLVSTFSAVGDYKAEGLNILVLYSSQAASLVVASLLFGDLILIAITYSSVSIFVGWSFVLWQSRAALPRSFLGMPQMPGWASIHKFVVNLPQYSSGAASRFGYQSLPVLVLTLANAGVGSVAVYQVCRSYIGLVRQVALQLGRLFGMEVARLEAAGEHWRAGEVLWNVSSLLLSLTLAGSALAVVAASSFFQFWTLGSIEPDTLVIAVLGVGTAIATPLLIGAAALVARGEPGAAALAAYLSLGLAGVIAAMSYPIFGLAGVAVSFAGTEVVMTAWLLGTGYLTSINVPWLQVVLASLVRATCAFFYFVLLNTLSTALPAELGTIERLEVILVASIVLLPLVFTLDILRRIRS